MVAWCRRGDPFWPPSFQDRLVVHSKHTEYSTIPLRWQTGALDVPSILDFFFFYRGGLGRLSAASFTSVSFWCVVGEKGFTRVPPCVRRASGVSSFSIFQSRRIDPRPPCQYLIACAPYPCFSRPGGGRSERQDYLHEFICGRVHLRAGSFW